MSLGQQLAPHLPFLRRFARSLLGDASVGDGFVRGTLLRIVEAPEQFPRDVDPRLGLYRTFLETLAEGRSDPLSGASYLQGQVGEKELIALARLDALRRPARAALLLTTMEHFTSADAAYLLNLPESEIDALVNESLASIERQTRARVLIIEDDPIIAMDIETIVRELGHDVTDVATTRAEAIASARREWPGLVLADIQLADNSSGIDAVRDIKALGEAPVIFITAFPERLLTNERIEPTFLVTKPFERRIVKAAISQALFFDRMTVPTPPAEDAVDPTLDLVTAADTKATASEVRRRVRAIAEQDLAPLPGPVDVEAEGDQLRRAGAMPIKTAMTRQRVDVLWRLHADTAGRLSEQLRNSNAGASMRARVESARAVLAAPPDDVAALSLGVQSHGMERLLPAVRDALMDDVAADLEAFVTDLGQLAAHFSSYREFVGDAQTAALPTGARAALASVAQVLEGAPDAAVDPTLKADIAEVRTLAEQAPDAVSDLALVRTVGNATKAIGRSLRDTAGGMGKEARDRFVKDAGGNLGALAAKLAIGGAALALVRFAPELFAFLAPIIALGAVLQQKK